MNSTTRFLTGALVALAVGRATAITAADLSKRLAAGENIRLIDLRPAARFDAGSIPNAMNIPAAIILQKKLPPLNPVVLFDDGLGSLDVADIATRLNQRPGWGAEVLEGGYSSWKALAGAPRSGASGLREEDIHHITYEDLNALAEPVVLVDVRPVDPGAVKGRAVLGKKTARADASDPVSSFCAKKPGRSYQHSLDDFRKQHRPLPANNQKGGAAKPVAQGTPPLVVLVGAVTDDHRETIRKLRAEGYPRVLILAGGDESIVLEGRRGMKHSSGSLGEGIPADPSKPQPAKP